MSNEKDGGPAFPHENWETLHGDEVASIQSRGGMSLRDWFAGQALAGMTANPNANVISDISGQAYKAADAMLKERVS